MQIPQVLWSPDKKYVNQSNMKSYMDWLSTHRGLTLDTYESLWNWSVNRIDDFWLSIWEYYDIVSDTPVESILQLPEEGMIGTKWFQGTRINYAEHILSHIPSEETAIIFSSESSDRRSISWKELYVQVAKVAGYFRTLGVEKGDRVVSYMPNIPETLIAFLATQSLGAIWSSCSPDFGADSVIERFQQIEPKLFLTVDGYQYHGKSYDKTTVVSSIIHQLHSLTHVIYYPYLDPIPSPSDVFSNISIPISTWNEIMEQPPDPLIFERVPFDHPIWVLYSSGTTGKPKAITHSVGGVLLEHLKALGLHQNCQPGDRFFWYSTTGWMMWNYANAALLHKSTVVLYDGSATYPDNSSLWNLAKETHITHFGAGASYYIHCMREGMSFDKISFPALQSLGSTGSPLIPEAFRWIYEKVKNNVWLISLSGGTDVCSGFVGGSPTLPVYEGEIQCRMLGCAVEAWNEQGEKVINELGEMVLTKPMPSMPIYFWGDDHHQRYISSYFETYPGVWRHGDWIKITDRGTLVIYGRSDATLNRGGVRIGTSEIYRAVESVPNITDSMVISIDLPGGDAEMWLFVVLPNEELLVESIIQIIRSTLRNRYSPRHVPDKIVQVQAIPYTISGKKMETPIKKMFMGQDVSQAISQDAMKNPECLEEYVKWANDSLMDGSE